jgi:hypothetical protein
VLVAACAGPVSLDAPAVTGAPAAACRDLVHTLPDTVDDRPRVDVATGHGYAAAWGDPAIELRCGVPRPGGFDRFSTCQTTDGVDWYIPESQMTGRAVDITMTTVGRSPNVEVRIPATYFPPANAMVDLAPALKQALSEVRPCR